VFENRRIFGPKRDEVTGGWRKLRNEELHNLYSSPSQVKEYEMGRACSNAWERKGMHTGSWLESQKERDHYKDRPMREDNFKINLTEIGRGGYGLDSSGLEYKLVVGCREHDSKTYWLHKISGNY
jgi:hypothetical protein